MTDLSAIDRQLAVLHVALHSCPCERTMVRYLPGDNVYSSWLDMLHSNFFEGFPLTGHYLTPAWSQRR